MDTKKVEEKVEEIKDHLEDRYEKKPIIKYMTWVFGALVAVMVLGTVVVSCTADADPRTDARSVVLDSGK